MFLTTYKTTIKNLVRSITFWLSVAVVLIVVIQCALDGFYLDDSDSAFVLEYKEYVQCIINSCASKMLMYAMPIFTIVSVVLVLNRDYGDKFFEIEKSAGIKSSSYLLGRLAALITVNLIVLLIMNALCLHLYVFTRGGVEGITVGQYLADSSVRLLRIDLFVGMPSLIFYIGLTYCIGSIFKNGVPAAVAAIGYVIAFYACNLMFRHRVAEEYFDYYSPIPRMLRQYFHYYDTEWFEEMLEMVNTSLSKAAFCIMFLVGVAVLCSVVSYLRIRKRSI